MKALFEYISEVIFCIASISYETFCEKPIQRPWLESHKLSRQLDVIYRK